jgi:hypothetical protein
MIPENTVKEILAAAKVEDVAADLFELKKSGKSFYTTCPACNKEGKGKGLIITPSKGIYKCFSCDYGGKSAVNLLMEQKNLNYPEALKELADKYKILIVEEEEKKGPQKRKSKKIQTFCDRQLASSGLTKKDITATVFVDDKTDKKVEVYEAATRNQYGKIAPGDDMIIWYYDLEGKPILFKKPKTEKFEHLFRVRWQIPENHTDRNGRPIKYQSPAGSGSHLFVPEPIRRAYADGRVINRLYIQEGEKKADKACVHGIMSVGIMGIHNIGSQGHLPHDLMLIVQRCNVKEVVFLLDSDWDHLGENLKPGDRVDMRTASFYLAVRNYRDYFKAFNNHGIYLELYFGYVKENFKKDKGIDDLIVNSLSGRENDLLKDFNRAVNNIKETNGEGEFIQLHKVTALSDVQIMQLWGFENSKSFLKKHKETLLDNFPNGEVFKIGKLEWRWDGEKEEFAPAQDLTIDEQYWEEIKWEGANGKPMEKLKFDYVNIRKFLRNRGYGRIRMANGKDLFALSKGKVVRNILPSEIRDFIIDFTEEVAPKSINQMILSGGNSYLGVDRLNYMYRINPVFEQPDKHCQHLYFQDKFWKVTNKGIEEKPLSQLNNSIWDDKIIDFNAKRTGPLLKAEMFTEEMLKKLPADQQDANRHYVGQFNIEFTQSGNSCHFLQFLNNTSEFAWRKMLDPKTRKKLQDKRDLDEKFETNMHLVSKLTALGYLLHDYHNKSVAKMVIAMDGKLSEVGQSNGRSGKSLGGVFIGKIIPQIYIAGKQKNLTEDPFLMEGVTEKTKNVFIDDVRTNIDIEFFYPHLTGQFTVRGLGQAKFNLPEDEKPKIFLATNHGINDKGGSFRDRIFMIAFSDFYNEKHKPINDFGINFFDDWDEHQYNLAYNMAALCLELFFKHGLVEAPLRRLQLRNLRQEMGDVFLEWADTYYAKPNNLGARLIRKDIDDDYIIAVPTAKKYHTAHNFKKKLKAYASYRDYVLNPELYDEEGNPKKYDKKGNAIEHDKSGGVEYITISPKED